MEVAPLPPEEVRITLLTATPYPDGQRVRVAVEMTPFQIRPWLEFVVSDENGDEVASANVIEPLNYRIELTMHIRKAETEGKYGLVTRLFYPEKPDNDRKEISFEIKAL